MTDPTFARALFVGRATYDVLYRLDALPEENSKVFAQRSTAAPGGPALNASQTHAMMGGETMLIAAVGTGPWANAIRAELSGHGIELINLAEGSGYEAPLASAWIHAGNGSRTVVNPPIWNGTLPRLAAGWPPELEPPARLSAACRWSEPPAVVLTDGFLLPETLKFLTAFRKHGAAICLDGGSWKPGTERLAPLLSVAICSERFAAPDAADGPEGTLEWFAAQGVPCVAVTRGERPIMACERGRRFEIEIEPIEAVDTLGAGDVLHGAFCHEFAHHGEFEPALRHAAQLATRSCLGLGVLAALRDQPQKP